MPAAFVGTAAGFEVYLRERLRADTALVRRAALDAANRGVGAAVAATDKAGSVDLGGFKAAWKAEPLPDGAMLLNDAPYAAVIEHGRRPGRPGPPLAPIVAWVSRKLRGRIRGEFKFARALGVGLSKGTKAKAAVRQSFRQLLGPTTGRGREQDFVDGAVYAVAKKIRDSIHAKGTRPRLILASLRPKLKQYFREAALRQLRRK